MTTPAELEREERIAPPAAVQVLRQILAYRPDWPALPERMDRAQTAIGPAALLPEWLSLARKAGVAVPPELLPEMLDVGERHVGMRDVIAEAVGTRGQRMAATNPAWAYATPLPQDLAAAWTTGTTEMRLRILRHLRHTDPAAGVALLRSTWSAETRDDRVAFLDGLQTGLSLEDEPFLESILDEPIVEAALDDGPMISTWTPPREVRPTIVNLLAMLPGSRLVTRMFARLAPLLTLREPEGEDAWIGLQLPANMGLQLPADHEDEELRRYGIPHSLHAMLEIVPPSTWSAHWGRGPAELLQAARDIDDNDLIIRAWTDAAIRVRDGEYAEARLFMPGGKHPIVGTIKLAEVIPPERLESLALEHLSARGLSGTAPDLLQASRFPWSAGLTRAVLATVPAELALTASSAYSLREMLRGFAHHMHPATAVATLREQGDPHEGPWVDLLHLRHTLHQAFE